MSLTWIVLIVGLSAVGLATQTSLLHRLKHRHPQIWKNLGEPQQFWNFAPRHNHAVTAFYWSSQHCDLGDPVLTGLVITARILTVGACLLIVGLTVSWLQG